MIQMRLIDADKIIKEVYENPFVTDSVKTYVKCSVVEQPTVDTVPKEKYDRLKENAEILSKACAEKEYVVRCRDCKYQSKGENESESWNLCMFRPWLHIPTSDDHFCGYGERGEENGN